MVICSVWISFAALVYVMALEIEIDLYEYLGISIDSSTQEIKKAYKIKAKELHPDKNKDDPKASRLTDLLQITIFSRGALSKTQGVL